MSSANQQRFDIDVGWTFTNRSLVLAAVRILCGLTVRGQMSPYYIAFAS